jgi:16S rRNA (cytosine967-C5)-methyltransferase
MRPAARIQAAIDLVVLIETQAEAGGISTDEAIRAFFRQRRYAGAKDRRAVTTLALEVVRHRGADSWRLGEPACPRLRVALEIAREPGTWGPVDALFGTDDPHGPEGLSSEEAAAVETARSRSLDTAPPDARYGFPAFLTDTLTARFGQRLDEEMAAMTRRAGLDVRVNTLKSNIDKVRQGFEKQGISSEKMPWSPVGLRLTAGERIDGLTAYAAGEMEVQDEGSQIAALLTGARPGEQVLDLCAGAGGKTLALAAMMENKGQIFATDTDVRRLKPIHERLQKAGVRNIQAFALDVAGRQRLAELKGRMDLVVIDSPCSGSGTWRRDPGLPWRLTPQRLEALNATQLGLLHEGAEMLRPGGRMVYITCSIILEENEKVVEHFLSELSGWALLPYREMWRDGGEGAVPPTLSANERLLQMSPARHGTDGFFVAVLEAPH